MSGLDTTSLRVERTFDAPAEAVFDAWTNPEVLRRWWSIGPSWKTPVAEVDLRVGGGYRLSMQDGESGERHTVYGEYHEITRPDRLLYSWIWEGTGPTAGHASLVDVTFRAEGSRTTVVVEHTGLLDEASRDRHADGWRACLEQLGAQVFAAAAPQPR